MRKSTLGYIRTLETKLISWNSKKQKVVALSSIKEEYTIAINAVCEVVWL
uniref:Uncharacterized protein n=1 Tax=Rhizophora mucronata TaxID=61149 RepID=A0A2P2NXQ0_RHIMU